MAVVLMNCCPENEADSVTVKLALPLASVVTVVEPGRGAADDIVRGARFDQHAILGVAQGCRAADVRADVVAFNRVVAGDGPDKLHADLVPRDQVPGRGDGAADEVAGRTTGER